MCLGTRSSTLSVTLFLHLLTNLIRGLLYPQVSLKQQLIAYHLRTLNVESEARESVPTWAHSSWIQLKTFLIAPLPDVLTDTSSSTTTTSSSDEELTRRRCEEVKRNQLLGRLSVGRATYFYQDGLELVVWFAWF